MKNGGGGVPLKYSREVVANFENVSIGTKIKNVAGGVFGFLGVVKGGGGGYL